MNPIQIFLEKNGIEHRWAGYWTDSEHSRYCKKQKTTKKCFFPIDIQKTVT